MGRLLRFIVFFVVLAGLLVFVVAPAILSPILTQYVRDMGVKADTLTVSVDYFDPQLLFGRASRLRVQATGVQVGRAEVGQLDLALNDVSFFDRSFDALDGQMNGVTVSASGVSAQASAVSVSGPANDATTSGQFDEQASANLVRAAAKRVGIPLDRVDFVKGGLVLQSHGVSVPAGISVAGGALVLTPTDGNPVVLLQPATSDPWRLEEAFVTPQGITVRGSVDTRRIVDQMTANTP